MVNLLQETSDCITGAGYTPNDIVFIGSTKDKLSCTWEEFAAVADRNYDNGFGGAEVYESLIIVFNDGSWMERGQYDGSEWWEFKKTPDISGEFKKFPGSFNLGLLLN